MKPTRSSHSYRARVLLLVVTICLSIVQLRPAQAAEATHYYVHDQGDLKTNNTTCDQISALTGCSLRGAIQLVNDAAGPAPFVIHVPAGTFNLTLPALGEDENSGGDLDITSANSLTTLTIDGAGIGVTIIDGNDHHDRVIDQLGGAKLWLTDMTIQHGSPSTGLGGGGGIRALSAGKLTLDGVRVTDNHANGINAADSGGGIFASGSDLSIKGDSRIDDNSACHGGGIMVNNGTTHTVDIAATDVFGNYALCELGGGILLANNATAAISLTNIYGNHARRGAGYVQSSTTTATISGTNVYNNVIDSGGTGVAGMELNGDATITWSQIYDNTGLLGAGGIELQDDSDVTIEDSAIRSNSGTNGGGVRILANTAATLRRVSITGNSAHNGGGIAIETGGDATLENVTIADNEAVNGGGIFLTLNNSAVFDHITVADNIADTAADAVYFTDNSTWTSRNSIYASAAGGSVCVHETIYILINNGHNITSDNNSCHLNTASDRWNIDPMLAEPGYYQWKLITMALLPGSPAIDGGIAADPVTTDQRTKPRVDGDLNGVITSDIGAHEYYLNFSLPMIIKP